MLKEETHMDRAKLLSREIEALPIRDNLTSFLDGQTGPMEKLNAKVLLVYPQEHTNWLSTQRFCTHEI